MNWSITYRDKDGKQAVMTFDAETREAVFKVLASKGIRAIRIEQGQIRHKRKDTVSRSSVRRVVAWVCVVLVLAIGALFAVYRIGNESVVKPHPDGKDKTKRISEVAPTVATVVPAKQPEPDKPVRKSAKGTPIPDNVQPDERGVLRYPGGLRWVDTNDLHIVKHPRKKQLFKHHSENSIATILTLEPEKMAPFLVGKRPKFGQRFVDDFKASLYDEPEFPDDDTQEERDIRNMVLDVKKELKTALERGEDIAQLMNDAQDELDRLVSYRDTLMKQLKEIKNDDKYSDNDVRDFTEAANQMLKKQGLKELATPNLTYRQFMLQRKRERSESQQSET